MRRTRNDYNFDSINGLAFMLEVSPSTIYRWIKTGNLVAEEKDGKLNIVYDQCRDFIREKLKEKRERPVKAFVPEGLEDYSEWHLVVDYFCWLLKVCYTSKEDIKRKVFRLDFMFANYLLINKVSLNKTKKVFLTNPTPDTRLIVNDLKRGWYNELAYSFPIKESTLSLKGVSSPLCKRSG